jgi:hypothetical protein
MNVLASINTRRHMLHEAGQVVHIHWDEHQFTLTRANFVSLVRVLEQGVNNPYADEGRYSVVQVDDEVREVWIENACLSLNHREYRALLNAALTTETRLHGFRPQKPPQDKIVIHPIPLLRRIRQMPISWN